jgi:hypothetical protein
MHHNERQHDPQRYASQEFSPGVSIQMRRHKCQCGPNPSPMMRVRAAVEQLDESTA